MPTPYEPKRSCPVNVISPSAAIGDLALLWQIKFAGGVEKEFLTVWASLGWRSCEEIEDGLPDGRHARLWRWSPDSFFSVPLLLGGGIGGRRRRSWSSRRVGVTPSRIYLRSGRGQAPP